jgi:serine/threonine protein phosphatase PrpC
MRDAVDFANMQILGAAAEHPELQGMGTTACVVVFQDDKAWIAHIGDSRIYLFVEKDKRLHRLTQDHSYVQGLVEQGIIYADEAENHPDKNIILKALGIKEELNPDISENPVLPAHGDIFLICSDGLSGMTPDKEIDKILVDKTSLKDKEAMLMSAAKTAGGLDNITFLLAEISQSPHRKSVFESKNPTTEAYCNTSANKTKYIVIATLVIICISAVLWIGSGKTSQSEKQDMPADTTKIINRPDTTIDNPDNQINQI